MINTKILEILGFYLKFFKCHVIQFHQGKQFGIKIKRKKLPLTQREHQTLRIFLNIIDYFVLWKKGSRSIQFKIK